MYGSQSNKKKKKSFHQGGNGKLTDRQKETLKRHSKHHTKKHIDLMAKLMKEGKTFGEAHKVAKKQVGK